MIVEGGPPSDGGLGPTGAPHANGDYEPLRTEVFHRFQGPLSAWQEADGRMYLGNPAEGGIALYVERGAGQDAE